MKHYLVEQSPHLLILLSEQDIEQRLRDRKFTAKTRAYDESQGKWIELGQIFSRSRLRDLEIAHNHPVTKKEWYYLLGQNPVGTFSFVEMIRLLQSKKIQPDFPVWKASMPKWVPLWQTPEFRSEKMKELTQVQFALVRESFERRKSKRTPFVAQFAIHDEDKLWKGTSFEVGAGGLGLYMEGSLGDLAKPFHLHMTSRCAGVSSFSAVGKVVCRQKDLTGKSPDKFGVEFIDIRREAQIEIQQFIEKKSK